jgi:peptidoglycan/LPS O-acetylase OafA/YrhL
MTITTAQPADAAPEDGGSTATAATAARPRIDAATAAGGGGPTTPGAAAPAAAEPAPVAPTGSTGRIPHLRALDGLRGFAVVIVVLSHFTPGATPGGFLGVDLFFVLSGFLITSLLVTEWESSGTIALGDFWIRRARRLLPALLAVVVVVGLHGALTASDAEMHQLGLDGLGSLFYVANWRFIASGQSYVMEFIQTAPSPLRHMWSLAIEEQFYVVWPLVVIGAAAIARRLGPRTRHPLRWTLVGVCAVLGIASATWMVVNGLGGTDLDRIYYGTDTRVFMILAGAAVGAVCAGRPQLPRAWRLPTIGLGVLAAGALVLATLTVETADEWLYTGGYVGLAVVLVALLLAAGQPGPNPVARVLATRPLVGLGLISYGVYLWHWPIAVWVTEDQVGGGPVPLFLVRSALTLAASLLSYRLIEQPIRRHGLKALGRARWAVAPVAMASLAVWLLVPVVAFPAIDEAPEGRAPSAAASFTTATYAASPRCDVAPNGARLDPVDDEVVVQLIGNSLAGEVRDCLTGIFEPMGARMETVNPPGFLICREVPAIQEQATDPATRPDVAILFAFVAYDDRCGDPWHAPVDALIDTWLAQGTQVFLVPTVDVPEGGNVDLRPGIEMEHEYYRQRAAADPRITVVDAGRYLRDTDGSYLWRMPCVDAGEPGCRPDGTVPVRFTDGVHFCTDAEFATKGCRAEEDAAGQRRAAASIAVDVIDTLDRRRGGTGLSPTPTTSPPTTGAS